VCLCLYFIAKYTISLGKKDLRGLLRGKEKREGDKPSRFDLVCPLLAFSLFSHYLSSKAKKALFERREEAN
jgi:hypothetical protein